MSGSCAGMTMFFVFLFALILSFHCSLHFQRYTACHSSSCGLYLSRKMIRVSLERFYSYFFKPTYWLSHTGPQCSSSVLSSFQLLPIPRCRYIMMVVSNVALKQLQHNLLSVFKWIFIVIIILLSTQLCVQLDLYLPSGSHINADLNWG